MTFSKINQGCTNRSNNSETRQIHIESWAFENANLKFKKILGSLKVRSTPVDEWILHTMSTETFACNTEALVGEAISKGMRRHQNAKCLNCGIIGYLRRNSRQGFPRNNISSGNDKNRGSQPAGLCRKCDKG